MIYKHLVIFIDSSRVVQQFLEVSDVLFEHGSDLLKLGKFVAVVVLEHATRAHQLVANAAEVLNLLLWVLEAVDSRLVCQLRLR